MSDEKLNFDTSNETVTSNGAQEPVDQNIVESTAEVISESVTTEAPSGEAAKEEAPTYSYETYSTNTSTNEYMHADAGSATGNGSYQYSGANHEYYQGENYGSSVGSGTGGNGNGNRGGRGKGFLAVVLAIIFGAVGLNQCNKQPGQFKGKGLAIAGLVLGIILLLLFILFLAMGGLRWSINFTF